MRSKILPLAFACISARAFAEGLTSGSGPDISWLRLAMAFLFCVGLAVILVFILRTRQEGPAHHFMKVLLNRAKTTPGCRIRILETRRASQYGDLCLVEVAGRVYFLALTAGGATVLDKQEETDAAVGTEAPAGEKA